MFGAAVKTRSAGFDAGLLPVFRVPDIRVVSVGNIRAGGSGKTPVAMYLAQKIQDAGVQTALLLRGYKGALEHTGGLVSLGAGPLVEVESAGDEAYLAALRLTGVQVWVGQDRIASVRNALARGARVAVLDDGFQHRRLHRDLDIVLACPEDADPETTLLPDGPLRETADATGRADLMGGLASDWKHSEPGPELLFDYAPTQLVIRRDDGSFSTTSLDPYRGKPCYLVSGIARPERFEQTVIEAGFSVMDKSVFNDHHRFTGKDIISIAANAKTTGAELILTTEKDLVRMSGFASGLQIFGLRIDVQLVYGEDILEDSLESLTGE